MRRLITVILILTGLGLSQIVYAYDILVVQDSKINVYQEVFEGFKSVVPAALPAWGSKSVYPHSVVQFVISEPHQDGELERKVKSFAPDAILAIGREALDSLKDFSKQSIVYILVPFPPQDIINRVNITGVDMNISPARQLDALMEAIPNIKRIGLVYDPAKAGKLAKAAILSAQKLQITVVAREVNSPREVTEEIFVELASKVDALWLIPDLTVITPETLATLHSLALQNKLPVLAFSEKYLQYGVAVSVSLDIHEMGKQAGEMVKKILTGTEVSEIPVTQVEKIRVSGNRL